MKLPAITAEPAVLLHVAALGVMWGSAFLFIKYSLDAFSPVAVTVGRLAIGALVLWTWLWCAPRDRSREHWNERRTWTLVVALAVVASALPNTLIAWSITELPTTAAAITNATTPLFTAAIVVVFAFEPRPRPVRLLGIVLGFVGVAVMFGFGFAGGSIEARVALLVAAFSYACGFVLTGVSQLRRLPLVRLAALQLSIAAVMTLPIAAAGIADEPPRPALGAVVALIALGLLSTGLPTVVYVRAVRRFGATSASLATYVVPIVGTALGVVFLGETLGPLIVVGAVVTAAGIVLAESTRAVRSQEQVV